MLSWQQMTYKPNKLGETDLVLISVYDKSLSEDLCMQDYKYLRAAVMFMPPWLTHRQTHTQTAFDWLYY